MKPVLVWDLPTRLFHWLLVVSFLIAFGVGVLGDEHSPGFIIHMVMGLVAGLLVLFRILWGFVGTRYARFRSFLFGPGEVAGYMTDALAGRPGKKYLGHNPGSSVAIFAMLVLVSGIVGTGLLMGGGESEFLEEVHELFAYSMIAVVGVHVAGVLWHMARHRENIVLSMFTGKKEGDPSQAISSARPLAGLALIGLIVGWVLTIHFTNDPSTGQLNVPVLGVTMQLETGEREGGGHDAGSGRVGDREEHEKEEDD